MAGTVIALPQARRIALAAQGFGDPVHTQPSMRTLQRTLKRTGVLQIDSVNVLTRAHYMPLYSRMGPYPTDLLKRATQSRPRRLVEYWAHVQAFMPVDLWPAMKHRRDHYRAQQHKWWGEVPTSTTDRLVAEIGARGALSARDLDTGEARAKEHWGWNWSQARIALDLCFMTGQLAIAGRTAQFEPLYDLPERVIPAEHLNAPSGSVPDQHLELTRRAIASHGIGTARHIADYYRMKVADTTVALASLVASGEVERVQIDSLRQPAYLSTAAERPRRIRARTLLSPFDPVVWERHRALSLFGFNYRIEIYTPAHKRVHGYYVLPFLLDDQLVARVDLKADRAGRRLVVKAAHGEVGSPPQTAHELAAELRRIATWLDLDDIQILPVGDLAPALSACQSRSASA